MRGAGGRDWRDTTIRGQVDRGTGILNNPVYVGRLEWNRCSYVKDPRTGKTVARPNPRNQWEVVPRPDLQIVSDELWEAVKARRAEVRIVMTQMVKTRHRAEDEGRLEASAALWFAPLSPPGTTRPRQAQGAGPTELAGLAGTQPVLAKMGAGAQPTAR